MFADGGGGGGGPQEVEAFYAAVSEREGGVDLPLKPQLMWKNGSVPLHPGAEKYYREKVYMK